MFAYLLNYIYLHTNFLHTSNILHTPLRWTFLAQSSTSVTIALERQHHDDLVGYLYIQIHLIAHLQIHLSVPSSSAFNTVSEPRL